MTHPNTPAVLIVLPSRLMTFSFLSVTLPKLRLIVAPSPIEVIRRKELRAYLES